MPATHTRRCGSKEPPLLPLSMVRRFAAIGVAMLCLCDPVGAQSVPRAAPDEVGAAEPIVLRALELQRQLEERIGFSLTRPVVLRGFFSQDAMREHAPSDFPADATIFAIAQSAMAELGPSGRRRWARQDRGTLDTCTLLISDTLAASGSHRLDTYLAHELFHCFQFERIGIEAARALPLWIKEGSAVFAAEELLGAAGSERDYWIEYLTGKLPLFARSYDAVGFFFHLKARDLNAWHGIRDMLDAGASRAFATAVSQLGTPGMQTWPMALARRPDLGSEWDTRAVALPSVAREMDPVLLTAIPSARIEIPGAHQLLIHLAFPSRKVLNFSSSGQGGIRWYPSGTTGHTDKFAAGATGKYCLGDSCRCPDGSWPEGVQSVPPSSEVGDALIAVTAATRRATLNLSMTEPECTPELATTGLDHDRCVVGTWVADQAFMEEQLRRLLKGKATIHSRTGEDRVTYLANGTAKGTVTGSARETMHLPSGDVPLKVDVDSKGTAAWGTRDSVLLACPTVEAFAISRQVDSPRGQSGAVDIATGECIKFPYVCSGDVLELVLPGGVMRKRYQRARE